MHTDCAIIVCNSTKENSMARIVFVGDWLQISGRWYQVEDVDSATEVVLDTGDVIDVECDTVTGHLSDQEFENLILAMELGHETHAI
jgi:hypothetical protein